MSRVGHAVQGAIHAVGSAYDEKKARFFTATLETWAKLMNRNPKLPYYRTKYQAGRFNRVLRVELPENRIGKTFWMDHLTGGVKVVSDSTPADVVVKVDAKALIDMILGWSELDPLPDGSRMFERFSPMLAYQSGRLVPLGTNGTERGYLNDLWMFGKELWDDISKEFMAILRSTPEWREKIDMIESLNRQLEATDHGVLRSQPFVILPAE